MPTNIRIYNILIDNVIPSTSNKELKWTIFFTNPRWGCNRIPKNYRKTDIIEKNLHFSKHYNYFHNQINFFKLFVNLKQKGTTAPSVNIDSPIKEWQYDCNFDVSPTIIWDNFRRSCKSPYPSLNILQFVWNLSRQLKYRGVNFVV